MAAALILAAMVGVLIVAVRIGMHRHRFEAMDEDAPLEREFTEHQIDEARKHSEDLGK